MKKQTVKIKSTKAIKSAPLSEKVFIETIKELRKEFTTKDDLKKFATKDDLKGFATKDDLKKFATKDDLNNYPTKDFLDESIQQLLNDISDLFYSKFEENDKRWETADKNFERMLIGQDRILKELENIRDDNNASTLHFERNDISIKNHEKRLKSLEAAKN